jgi:hypothetical protein
LPYNRRAFRGWSKNCIRNFSARPCVLTGGKIAKRFCAAARQPVGDKDVHSATRCAWWQTPQFCQNKIATAGLQRIIAVGNYAPRKLQKAIFWPGSELPLKIATAWLLQVIANGNYVPAELHTQFRGLVPKLQAWTLAANTA